MLNKRFKIAKCKTSLKLATSRIKLMRNKKGVQINQMKQELAQLLESGQDRTARIRVEHVIREEKMVAAYDLVEIYCELIVARLPIIESQKTCPIDLKEAVASVIFAAPRCSDIPELADAKKNFTAKYGKEFVSAAVELRPDCGVSRMLVEKLSAVAPDVQTKVKVLSAVAKEHNINWDPTSFEEKESKPPDDLLNGPTYFEKASTISVDSPKIRTSYVQNVHSHEGNPNEHFDFAQQNRRFTIDAQNGNNADTHNAMGPSGLGSGMMYTSQSFNSNNSNSSFSGKEKWNMEFKDATSAAQAAAESAERASIAARAAAQLSSQGKITRQYSTESYSNEQNPRVSYTDQHSFKDSYNNTSFKDRKSKMQNQQTGPTEIDASPKATEKSSSLRSRNDSMKENSVNYFETHETSSKKESRARFTNGRDEGSSQSANVDYYGEGVNKKRASINPSRAHSTTIGNERDDLTFDQRNGGQRKVVDQENVLRDAKYDDVHADDESDSDAGPRFDAGFEFDEAEAKSFFPSPERVSVSPPESPKKNISSTMGRVGSAKSADHSVKYDLSDGPGSETETETTQSTFSDTKKSASRVDPGYVEPPPNKVNITKSRIELNDLVETGSSFRNEYDDFDTGKDLKFGTLTSGFRNKSGLKYPPYMKPADKGTVEVDPTFKQSSFSSRASRLDDKKPSVSVSKSESQSSFNSRASRADNKKPSVYVSKSESDSDSDDNNETFRVQDSFKTRSQFADKDSSVEVDPTFKQSSFNSRASRLDDKKPSVSVSKSESQSSFNSRASRADNKKPSVYVSKSESDSDSDSDDNNETFRVQDSFKTRSQFADKDSSVEVDPTFKQSSFNSRASRLDDKKPSVSVSKSESQSSFNSRASRADNKKPSVYVSKSESDSDSDSDDNNETFRVQHSFKTRSQFAPPGKFFNNDETDSEEEVSTVPKRMSTSKVQLGPGFSRRSKGQVEPVGKTVISNPSPSENLKKNSEAWETSSTSAKQKANTRSNITKSSPEPRPDLDRFKQEPSRTKPEPKISEPLPNPRKTTMESRKTEAPKTVNVSSETKLESSNVKKPSHVHPKLPEYDSLAARIQALSKMNH